MLRQALQQRGGTLGVVGRLQRFCSQLAKPDATAPDATARPASSAWHSPWHQRALNPVRIPGAVRGPLPSDRPSNSTARFYIPIDGQGRAYATGRRKRAVARVWVWESENPDAPQISINGKSITGFFGGHWDLRYTMLSPFIKTDTAGLYSMMAITTGGGLSGQTEALRHGIATAMQGLNFNLRPTLKEEGFLKRDPRQRERKKPGQAGARKKFAWVKR